MDVVNVVRTLDSNLAVLGAEVHELDQDLQALAQLGHKYGRWWDDAALHLRALRVDNRTKIKEIRHHLKQFERHVAPARALCDRLAAANSIHIQPLPDPAASSSERSPDLLITVVSPILANAQHLPPPPSHAVSLWPSPRKDCVVVQCSPTGPLGPRTHPHAVSWLEEGPDGSSSSWTAAGPPPPAPAPPPRRPAASSGQTPATASRKVGPRKTHPRDPG